MGYLPSGTTYPGSTTNVFPGILNNGDDFVAKFYNSSSDLNNVSGVNAIVSTSKVFVNYSGVAGPVFVIGTPISELQSPLLGNVDSATPNMFRVYDVFGGAAGKNIIVSGTSPVTINGASTATISTAYGVATFLNVSGNAWIKF